VLLTHLERHEAAESQFKKALEVDPLSVSGNWIYSFCLFLSRHYDDSIRRAQRSLELDPNFGVAHLSLAFAYQMKGEFKRSVESYARYSDVMGFPENANFIRESFNRGWEGFLEAMTSGGPERPKSFSAYIIAVFFATLGNADGAFHQLNASFEKRESHIVMLKADPRMDALRDDPRFEHLLDRIGFPQ
jgi:tetratricopeptide (TPR) repeat protein